ncbi:DEAD/DEAH box helicase [Billgrantia gudaonensis]|uniref:Superfamily II DNA or RNA helicase n=1 Tax=Billgrantia gudaonensis TaxID=376427 RepID=A0A1G8YLL9_9GAMM|nr:DEAD/DEAH box helicase family protein [Halomonas gudaonensis]SDK03567.1 Superfamily II DNA or RNA helicase [Halomonas gudaonensis]
MADLNLRPWQTTAIKKAEDWLLGADGGKHFLINAAPGSGKTICASVIAKQLYEKGEIDRTIVIAPRAEVVRQWSDEFKFVTGKTMMKVTGADHEDLAGYGLDLCATWAAVEGLLDGFQSICLSSRTLVICDEHHHAAIEAAWGRGANGAFAKAKYVLVLTGTPIRSDGQEPVWFAYDDNGRIDHPDKGSYTLTYGEAVDLDYCRPITFHRHEGKFTVSLPDGDNIAVSGTEETNLEGSLKRISGLQQALEFYKLACTPHYTKDGKADLHSYQGTMLEWAIAKLDDLRNEVPSAGGLVIAPSIEVAEYMAEIIETMEGEKPTIVHSRTPNPEAKIKAFKETTKKWLVSVAMISEGVDIKRLRILVYLPSSQTELSFRQSMGRVVRSLGPDDCSRAYVVMPTHRIFEEYARRVEMEMSSSKRGDSAEINFKLCPVCEEKCSKLETSCSSCSYEFPATKVKFKTCPDCDQLNPLGLSECQFCGCSFMHEFEVSLDEALRMGAIVRGMDIEETEVVDGEKYRREIKRELLSSGDEALINIVKRLPEESWGRLRKIINKQ